MLKTLKYKTCDPKRLLNQWTKNEFVLFYDCLFINNLIKGLKVLI